MKKNLIVYKTLASIDEVINIINKNFSFKFNKRDSDYLGEYFLYKGGDGIFRVYIKDNIIPLDGEKKIDELSSCDVIIEVSFNNVSMTKKENDFCHFLKNKFIIFSE